MADTHPDRRERLFDSDALQVGDLWPRHGSARMWGPIVRFDDYPDRDFAAEYGITRVAVFADGTEMSIGGHFPGSAGLIAELAAYRTNPGSAA